MKKYRILRHDNTYWTLSLNGKTGNKTLNPYVKSEYIVQKRFLGFLWWYNFENIDGVTDGCYDTLEEAQLAIKKHQSGCRYNENVVEEYE